MTADLAAYLRARWGEEAALAEAASPGPWHVNAESDEVLAVDGITVAEGFALSGRQLRATTEHIALQNPAFVLGGIEAKRELLELHSAEPGQHPDFCQHDKRELPCPTLRILARPYRGRDDFNSAWLED